MNKKKFNQINKFLIKIDEKIKFSEEMDFENRYFKENPS